MQIKENIFVNFTTSGFSKTISQNIDTISTDKEELRFVANALRDIKIKSEEPIGFKSIPELVGLDYMGYIIEKERLDDTTNKWIKIDEYKIIGPDANIFKDTRLAFGNAYRYRIRSVSRYTVKKHTIGFFGSPSKTYYTSFYYESRKSDWVYINTQDSALPNYPEAIDITVNSYEKLVRISWLKPLDRENLLRSYNVYRREKIGDRWKKLAVLNEKDNLFTDTKVEIGKKYIYSLSSNNLHGIESFLSFQVQVELNGNIKIEKKEKPLVFISGPGLKPTEVFDTIKSFTRKVENIIARKNISLSPAKKLDEDEKILLLKIKSLDTHETQELRVVLKNLNIGNELKEIE